MTRNAAGGSRCSTWPRGEITPLAETRTVDDQPAWLDDSTVAYGIQRSDGVNDVWAVPADGTGTPEVVVPEASSPAPW